MAFSRAFLIIRESEPEPLPVTLFVAPIASVAVIGVCLLVYFRKG